MIVFQIIYFLHHLICNCRTECRFITQNKSVLFCEAFTQRKLYQQLLILNFFNILSKEDVYLEFLYFGFILQSNTKASKPLLEISTQQSKQCFYNYFNDYSYFTYYLHTTQVVGGGFLGWMLDVGEDGWMVLELGGGGWKLGRDECR